MGFIFDIDFMSKSVKSQNCFLLHAKKYTDSKILVSLLTPEYGVAQSVVRIKKRKKVPLPPLAFTPLRVSWLNSSSILRTVIEYEHTSQPYRLVGTSLFCGIYLNELVIRLLKEQSDVSRVFDQYEHTLAQLEELSGHVKVYEPILRQFEMLLLQSLGFGLLLSEDVLGNELVSDPDYFYRYIPDSGFEPLGRHNTNHSNVDRCDAGYKINGERSYSTYSGNDLSCIARQHWSDASLSAAKRLLRQALAPHLGYKPIQARELFL